MPVFWLLCALTCDWRRNWDFVDLCTQNCLKAKLSFACVKLRLSHCFVWSNCFVFTDTWQQPPSFSLSSHQQQSSPLSHQPLPSSPLTRWSQEFLTLITPHPPHYLTIYLPPAWFKATPITSGSRPWPATFYCTICPPDSTLQLLPLAVTVSKLNLPKLSTQYSNWILSCPVLSCRCYSVLLPAEGTLLPMSVPVSDPLLLRQPSRLPSNCLFLLNLFETSNLSASVFLSPRKITKPYTFCIQTYVHSSNLDVRAFPFAAPRL